MKSKLTYECSTEYPRYREPMFTLRDRVYGSVPEKFYDSFYQGNPLGDPLLGLSFDGEKLVGQENYIRQDFVAKGLLHSGAMGINTLIDPNYRLFHGVFGKLCTLTMEHLQPQVDLLFAYANEESKKYYLKYFNWKITTKIGVYKKITSPAGPLKEKVLFFCRPGRRSAEITLVETGCFDASLLDPLIDEYRAQATCSYFFKTAAFLNWKYLANSHYPARGYYLRHGKELVGYCVTYDDGIEKKVLDFLVMHDDTAIFTAMISHLAWLSRSHGLRRLVLYGTPGCWYEDILKKQFFFKRWDIDFLTHAFNEKILSSDWIIQIGDFDMY